MNAYQSAVKEISDRRRADLDSGAQVWRDALASDDNLRAAHAFYQEEAVKKAQRLANELEKAREELAAHARRLGLTKAIIEPPVRCKTCNDTGYAGGKYCKCVIKRVIQSSAENLILPQVDFASAKKTAPKAIAKLYEKAEAYTNEYPDNDKPFFIILGSAGTGKTMLAAAIATEMISRGAATVTVSAFDMVKRAKDYHTQFAIEDYRDLFTPMLESDLLVIDDLGTETVLKNITHEYFYTIVNERWLRGRNTVITSNLTPGDMLNRYGEAVFSRLCDKTKANLFTVAAKNARI